MTNTHPDLAKIAKGRHGPEWRAWRAVARGETPAPEDLIPDMVRAIYPHASLATIERWLGRHVQTPEPVRTYPDLAQIARGRHGPEWRAWRAVARGTPLTSVTADLIRVIQPYAARWSIDMRMSMLPVATWDIVRPLFEGDSDGDLERIRCMWKIELAFRGSHATVGA